MKRIKVTRVKPCECEAYPLCEHGTKDHALVAIEGNPGEHISFAIYPQPKSEAEAQANARLIAAAPTILKELKHALRDVKAHLYAMPINTKNIERAILNAQIERYSTAIRLAENS